MEKYRLKCWLNSVKEWLIETSVKISVKSRLQNLPGTNEICINLQLSATVTLQRKSIVAACMSLIEISRLTSLALRVLCRLFFCFFFFNFSLLFSSPIDHETVKYSWLFSFRSLNLPE